ncbi:(Fe-S)-binding protein [Marinobacterium lutimaris]|uniref:Fe-S oxidoreductase n=1 Tax=Marinobacterium lutimaris TaxID=568106 RepID=A0A1H5W1R5_9GAMM|nr:(Fe-S)-binding protein [Marinobacterium lutimaris]SEF93400.1 Fe-S oxidoreductase [Marinobacterium lutimaris]
MKAELDWSGYENAGLGDAYADIPKTGGDYAKAVAVCINSMVCLRPIDRGVMCPSFRVHNEVAYSPGGRSRLIKRMLNGEITAEEQTTLDRAMDACVACKGCKRECDTNLDMATIRSEYVAQRSKSPSLRQKLFAQLPALLRYPWLVNLANSAVNASPWLQSALKLNPTHPLPRVQPAPELAPRTAPGVAGEVLLWVDSFTAHFAPQSAEAALRVLEAAGFRVHLLNQEHCGGRSAYSQGMIATARHQAQALIDALWPHVEEARLIIGLEPSTLLMLRDELLTLDLGDRAKAIAASALLFEEFLAREISANRLKLPLKELPGAPPVRVHGHCHQKAVGAMKSMRKVLKIVPGLDFDFIEASCCGGAGSFGFEAENAEDSQKMAELALLPKLAEEPRAELIANGFSCREQVARLGGPTGIHIAEILARHLA